MHTRFSKLRTATVGAAFAVVQIYTFGATATAREPQVPGLNELVVYDPGAHERGLPAVQFADDPCSDDLLVEIPPAVHVHRFYYSGDKEFQGPFIQGGPTVVVANHPKTGERLYLDVMLPAGAPTIAHNSHSITYVYPNQRVIIKFGQLFRQTAVIKYVSGKGLGRSVHEVRQAASERAVARMQGSQLAQSLKEAAIGTGQLARGVMSSAKNMTSRLVNGAAGAVRRIPGVESVKSLGEQQLQRRREVDIDRVVNQQARQALEFMPTNR